MKALIYKLIAYLTRKQIDVEIEKNRAQLQRERILRGLAK